ncbi:hypothetical protein [Streptomyces yanii]|uniref:Uncharacterized protein n=1 Tax=Streptomyces yanii TaxID=78510 RepID=A0ABV5RGW1_9ACTN
MLLYVAAEVLDERLLVLEQSRGPQVSGCSLRAANHLEVTADRKAPLLLVELPEDDLHCCRPVVPRHLQRWQYQGIDTLLEHIGVLGCARLDAWLGSAAAVTAA